VFEHAIQYISELVDNTAGIVNIREYGEIIREKALLRELITISNNIAQSAYKPEGKSPSQLVDEAEQKIFEIAERGSRNSTYLELRQMIQPTYDRLYQRSQKGGG
jgi:replicative DNA helicase